MNIQNWDTFTAKTLIKISDMHRSLGSYKEQESRAGDSLMVLRVAEEALINAIQDASKASDKKALQGFLHEFRLKEQEIYAKLVQLNKLIEAEYLDVQRALG